MRLILDKHRLFSISLLSHVAKLTISVSSHSHIAFKQHAKGGFFGRGGTSQKIGNTSYNFRRTFLGSGFMSKWKSGNHSDLSKTLFHRMSECSLILSFLRMLIKA